MFTGLVDHGGTILKITPMDTGVKLAIQTSFKDLALGESIAVDGACLTVTSLDKNQFTVELSQETLDLCIAKSYQPQQKVNLERALQMSDRLGGHFVSGHVDQTATVESITQDNEFFHYAFTDLQQPRLLVSKGSVTINGVSLTINKVNPNGIEVMLIPHTLEITNLSQLKAGDPVNIEFDLLAKLVAQQTEGVIRHEHTI